MATEKWSAGTARSGAALTTELNALADAAYSGVGPELDNATNLDVWCIGVLSVDFVAASDLNAPISLYAVVAVDGTNYEDGSASIRYPQDSFVGIFQVYNTTAAQLLVTKPFMLRPFKTKFAVYNQSGEAFPATGSTMTPYTFNRTIA